MARNKGKKERTIPRRKTLENLYKKIKDDSYFDYKVLNEVLNEVLNKVGKEDKIDDKLYLYLIQNGRCMYTNQRLEISQLSSYHIDHIIPQSLIKDDSFNNTVLVTARANMEKMDQPVSARLDISDPVRSLWENLYAKGFILKIKYDNLKKREFKDQDYRGFINRQRGFINRQIVEMKQISKYVSNLFEDLKYAKKIVSVKAQLTSNYRKENKLYKIRNLNDLHHAHDAYIACVVGKHVLSQVQQLASWTTPKAFKQSEGSTYEAVIASLSKDKDLAKKVRKVLNYKNVFITKRLKCNSGEENSGFWKQQYNPTRRTQRRTRKRKRDL